MTGSRASSKPPETDGGAAAAPEAATALAPGVGKVRVTYAPLCTRLSFRSRAQQKPSSAPSLIAATTAAVSSAHATNPRNKMLDHTSAGRRQGRQEAAPCACRPYHCWLWRRGGRCSSNCGTQAHATRRGAPLTAPEHVTLASLVPPGHGKMDSLLLNPAAAPCCRAACCCSSCCSHKHAPTLCWCPLWL